ncbi:hypothetical protein Dimus_004034 [Dionaea muscipula]
MRFANDDLIIVARRVKSSEIKPFQRLLHFIVMKNVVSRFGKRDTTSFIDLTYMDHLLTRRLVNLPRVMLRHMAYVISIPYHELPYGDLIIRVFEAYHVPLNDKEGANRRRDEDENDSTENVQNVELNEEEAIQEDFDWVQVDKEAELQRNTLRNKLRKTLRVVSQAPAAPAVPAALVPQTVQQTMRTDSGVDPSRPSGSIPDSDFLKLQVELDRAGEENVRL